MRLSRIPVGLLIKFKVLHLRAGIKRMVDGHDWQKEILLGESSVHSVVRAYALPSYHASRITKIFPFLQKILASVEISRNLTTAN